jgi:hypothetical protein
VAVTLRPVAGEPLAAVALETDGPEPLTSRLGRREPDCVAIEVSRGAHVLARRLVHAPAPDEVALVGGWLARGTPDPIYRDTLATLAAITNT